MIQFSLGKRPAHSCAPWCGEKIAKVLADSDSTLEVLGYTPVFILTRGWPTLRCPHGRLYFLVPKKKAK